jgi:regulator of sigma E protease
MITLLIFVITISVLVVVHEMGHYLVARLCGVKVLRFSVGFGKVLYGKRFIGGETEWVVSAIPLGGYLKMLDEREGEVATHELHLAFNRKPVLQRMAIAVAGPAANLLLAILLFWALFAYGVPGLKPVLGEVLPKTPAAAAHFKAEETIVSIDKQVIQTWEQMSWTLLDLALGGTTEAHIETRTAQGEWAQRVLNLQTLSPNDLDQDFLQILGLQPHQPTIYPVIGKVMEGGVAQQAGLLSDDLILRVDDQIVETWKDWVEIVRSHPGQLLRLEVERRGVLLAISITPVAIREAGEVVGKIGAAPYIDQHELDALLTQVRYDLPTALTYAVQKTWKTARVSLNMLGKMLRGDMSLKKLSGPIAIADYAGQSAQMGVIAYLGFLALISISLGVLNLLPIPLLDGGHLLYYTVELIKGSPLSEQAWRVGQSVGIALLVTVMGIALVNDIGRLL